MDFNSENSEQNHSKTVKYESWEKPQPMTPELYRKTLQIDLHNPVLSFHSGLLISMQ